MLAVGQCIGERYLLVDRIAAGGMGEVWRALDERLQRQVAVKILRPEHADDAAFRARLRLEAQSAGALSSDHVVDVYDWGEQPDESGRWLSYITMELVAGETVAAAVGRGPLTPALTASVLADTAAGLAAAHASGLVHRDVKPANLLINAAGRVKVADFGIARAKDGLALTDTGMLVGTALYLSPEQVRGEPATSASDIYSLGVVAYQCLTGAPPFQGDSDIATATARLHLPVAPLPATVPEPLRELITSMLDLDPSRRPTAEEVAAAARRVPPVGVAAAAAGVAAIPAPTLVMAPETSGLPSQAGEVTEPRVMSRATLAGVALAVGVFGLIIGLAVMGGPPTLGNAATKHSTQHTAGSGSSKPPAARLAHGSAHHAVGHPVAVATHRAAVTNTQPAEAKQPPTHIPPGHLPGHGHGPKPAKPPKRHGPPPGHAKD